MAAGVVPYGDPMNIGMVGMHGCYTSNRAVADCDVLIAVGARFSDRVALNPKTFAKNATIIQIDIDASELGKNVDVDLCHRGRRRLCAERHAPDDRGQEASRLDKDDP